MQHPAIKELYRLIRTPDWSNFYPEKDRQALLDQWVEKWIVDVKFSQSVVSTDYLTSEYNDIIRYKLAESLAQDLAEECTLYKTENKNISAELCAFRRKEKV